jgi:hypothetical protein
MQQVVGIINDDGDHSMGKNYVLYLKIISYNKRALKSN